MGHFLFPPTTAGFSPLKMNFLVWFFTGKRANGPTGKTFYLSFLIYPKFFCNDLHMFFDLLPKTTT
jgi:hypothetical protein